MEYWICSSCGALFSDEDGTAEIAQQDTVIPILAKSNMGISVSSAEGQPGDTVTVTVSLTENPGFAFINLKPVYDENVLDAPTIKSINLGGVKWTIKTSAAWSDADNTYYTGDILTLTFHIKEDAPAGDTVVSVEALGAFDEVEEVVGVDITAGSITITGGSHVHSMTEVPLKGATCTTPGNSAYWYCEECGKYFSDADGENEIPKDSWLIPSTAHVLSHVEANPATIEHDGNMEYWTCSLCGKLFSDENDTAEITQQDTVIPILASYVVTLQKDTGSVLSAFTINEDDGSGIPVKSGDRVAEGTVVYVTAAAKAGYKLTKVPDEAYTVEDNLTIVAESQLTAYKLTLNGENGTVSADVQSLDAVPYGTRVTVTAGEADENCTFTGWYQANGKLLSTSASYSFNMISSTTIVGKFEPSANVVKFVSGSLIKKTITGKTSISSEDLPADPSPGYGYEFVGWDKSIDEINSALANNENVTVNATFAPITKNITVTIYNGEGTADEERTLTQSQAISVTAKDVEGKQFAYWLLDGDIVSYTKKAAFKATKNCTLTACYTVYDVDATGTANITSASYNLNTKKLSMVAYLTVPDGGRMTQAGLIASNAENYSGILDLTHAQYVKNSAKASGKTAPLEYTWTKTSVSQGDIWYVRAYVVYTIDGNDQTVYGSLTKIVAGTDYDLAEKGTAAIQGKEYNSATNKATFNALLTVPKGSVIVNAGLVAASSNTFNPDTAILTTANADYVKFSAKAVGITVPMSYTWTKSSANSAAKWYVRAYLAYTLDGEEHVVYGGLVALETS